MKFVVRRTSQWDDSVPPCREAYRDQCVRLDIRTVDHPRKIAHYAKHDPEGKWWWDEGTNHRHIKVDGKREIVRDFPDECWFVDISTFEELMAFYDRHGPLVIGNSTRNHELPEIEIYDSYRE